MIGEEMRTLTLSRNDMFRIGTAISSVIEDFIIEIQNPNISVSRKKTAENSLKMWKTIREEIRKQLDEQDGYDCL